MTDLEQTQSDLRPKIKVVLFPEIGQVKDFLSLTRPHSRMRIRIHNFNLKEKKKREKTKKAKETKEEYKISVENLTGYVDIVCEYFLCTFNLHD